jgi:hypothetical protein
MKNTRLSLAFISMPESLSSSAAFTSNKMYQTRLQRKQIKQACEQQNWEIEKKKES